MLIPIVAVRLTDFILKMCQNPFILYWRDQYLRQAKHAVIGLIDYKSNSSLSHRFLHREERYSVTNRSNYVKHLGNKELIWCDYCYFQPEFVIKVGSQACDKSFSTASWEKSDSDLVRVSYFLSSRTFRARCYQREGILEKTPDLKLQSLQTFLHFFLLGDLLEGCSTMEKLCSATLDSFVNKFVLLRPLVGWLL